MLKQVVLKSHHWAADTDHTLHKENRTLSALFVPGFQCVECMILRAGLGTGAHNFKITSSNLKVIFSCYSLNIMPRRRTGGSSSIYPHILNLGTILR
jgi:hypothetical protein